jgi:hypothetical protein
MALLHRGTDEIRYEETLDHIAGKSFELCVSPVPFPPSTPPPTPSPPSPPQQPVELITSGTCAATDRITSIADCSAAAATLGMSDTTATNDGQTTVPYDPPFCYFEGGSLKWNAGGNTGHCTTNDRCLCYG